MSEQNIMNWYESLQHHFGPQYWWPLIGSQAADYDPRFEICLGAILTQNTAWKNVEVALQQLKRQNLFSFPSFIKAPPSEIAAAIRPAGYFRQKTKKLKLFCEAVRCANGFDRYFQYSAKELRKRLLQVWGIGPETADTIILYAAKKPSFVIDAYTIRMLRILGIEKNNYHEYKKFFEGQLRKNVLLWQEFHALIVAWGKWHRHEQETAEWWIKNCA